MLLKIGDLAKRAGLTVRTLHHYDAIGLLSPSARSDSGARHYGQHDVIRLHRILALKQCGCSLADIQSSLDMPDTPPQQIIERQISALDEQVLHAQALRDKLRRLRDMIAKGGEAGMADWLNLLEMMTMHEKYLSPQDLAALRQQVDSAPYDLDAHWQALTRDIQHAIDSALAPSSAPARDLAWRWMRMLKDTTGDNPQLAVKLGEMQRQEARAQQINGIDPTMFSWVRRAFAHARTELFASHVTPAELDLIRSRQLAHLDDWPPLFAALRKQLDAGASVHDPLVQTLARQWQQLFHDSYCGDDRALESKVRNAFSHEPDLMVGIGLNPSVIAFVQKAILALHAPRHVSANAGPKPSAQLVATQRAAHQLLDRPLVFDDPLALTMLGKVDAAHLLASLDQYDDPMSRGLRTSLVVRSRLAEDEWAAAARNGVMQYVILGAGMDTYAYRHGDAPGRVFEVDLPATQEWKRACLQDAGVAVPDSLTYVPIDFETGTLAGELARAGFQADQPAFFSWLGVVLYLDAQAVSDTLGFIASCAPGSAVVFDYLLEPSLLGPMERIGADLMASRFAARGEPWKSYFDPAKLVEQLHALGFGATHDHTAEELNARYLAGRTDGLRMGGLSRLMLAVV